MKQPLTEHQEAWLQALESGNYEQGKGVLKDVTTDPPSYCCLGIWCEMNENEMHSKVEENGTVSYRYGSKDFPKVAVLPPYLRDKLGLSSSRGSIMRGNLRDNYSLANANDNEVSFKDIAAFCRENPEAVFVST